MNFELSTCMLTIRDEDGFVRCQPEPYGSKGSLPNYEAFQPFGLTGRAKDIEAGIGANALVMRMGPDGRVLLGHDPRWSEVLPDTGAGGAALYATTHLSGNRAAPHVAIFGEGGAAAEGTFRVSVPTAAGTSTIEVNATTGDVTITHPSGTVAVVKATGVELGEASGNVPLVRYPELAAAWAGLTSAASSAGITVPPLVNVATTKVSGT